jgi:hypothetical protein
MANKDGPQRDTKAPLRDTRYLQKHQGLWRVSVGYRDGGKVVKLRRSLGTASLREAQRLRWPIVAEFKASITNTTTTHDEAEAWRAALAASSGEPLDQIDYAFSEHLDRLEAKHGERVAVEFADRVYGRATPIEEHLEAFLSSRGELRADTRKRHEGALGSLAGWLKANDLPQTLQAVTRKVATRYVDELKPGRRDPERLGLQWRWLLRRERVEVDVWSGLKAAPRAQRLADGSRIDPERAFTDREAQALLSGPCEPAMGLLMRVLALTGARLDAVIHMRVDLPNRLLIFPPQKQERGPRTIPPTLQLGGTLGGLQRMAVEDLEQGQPTVHRLPPIHPGAGPSRET